MLQLQRPPARRAYPRQQLATAGGYEAVAQQFQVDFRAHPLQQRQPAVAEKSAGGASGLWVPPLILTRLSPLAASSAGSKVCSTSEQLPAEPMAKA